MQQWGSASSGLSVHVDPCHPERRIPRMLHHAFIEGREAFDAHAAQEGATLRPQWERWCRAVYSRWKHMLWDEQATAKLIKEASWSAGWVLRPRDGAACMPCSAAVACSATVRRTLPPLTACAGLPQF